MLPRSFAHVWRLPTNGLLDIVEFTDPPQRLLCNRRFARRRQIEELASCMCPAGGFPNAWRTAWLAWFVEVTEARISVGMQHAGEGGQMLPGMQSLAIRTEGVADGRWCRVTMGTAIANIGPQPACPGLALAWFQHRDGRVVTMKAVGGEHMLAKLHQQRLQQCAGLADPVGHGRTTEINTFPGVNLGLAIERQVVAIFGDQDMGDEARSRLAALDGQRRHLGLDLRIAALAGEARLETVFVGRERQYNRRFLQMCSHYLIEPVACTPASGWEKGQVENQVNLVRERFFTPRLRFKSYDELNGWLLDKCISYARAHKHVDQTERTIWEVFDGERPHLVGYPGKFDGFHAVQASIGKTCLVRFDNNKYSVLSTAVGRPAEIHAYADRIVIRQDGVEIGQHDRCFGRGETIYNPWHYVPVLTRKPGALRNGAPFHDWVLPAAREKVRRRLKSMHDGDRQMVSILECVGLDGLPAVEAACQEALDQGVFSAAVIINILARKRDPQPAAILSIPDALRLTHEPLADCARYDSLRRAS